MALEMRQQLKMSQQLVMTPQLQQAIKRRQLSNVELDAFVDRDPELALAVCQCDKEVDNFYNSIFRNLVSYMMENPSTISSAGSKNGARAVMRPSASKPTRQSQRKS